MNVLDRKEHDVQRVACLLGMFVVSIAVIAVLVTFTSTATAHHEQAHNVFILG